MEPLNVNLNALDSRLRTIFSHMSRSTNTVSGNGGQSTIRSIPARSVADRNALARSAVTDARSVGSNDALDAAGLDSREIEQRVDQFHQALRIAIDGVEIGTLQHAAGRRGGFLRGSKQQRQRRAKLVADVAEECRLGPVDGRKRLGAVSFVFVRARIRQRGAELVRDQVEEAPVLIVERQPRIEPDDQPCRAA